MTRCRKDDNRWEDATLFYRLFCVYLVDKFSMKLTNRLKRENNNKICKSYILQTFFAYARAFWPNNSALPWPKSFVLTAQSHTRQKRKSECSLQGSNL